MLDASKFLTDPSAVNLAAATLSEAATGDAKVIARDVNVFYGEKQALNSVSVNIGSRSVTPSSARRAAASRRSCAASTA
jgi:hypothetical protein